MAYLLLILTSLFWAGNFVAARAIYLDIEPVMLAFLRWLLVMILIAPWALPRLWRARGLLLKHLPMLSVLSILSVSNFNTFLYIGLQDTNASNAALMQSATPITILILSGIFLRGSTSARQWLGILVSVTGVATLISQGSLDMLLALDFNPGDIWIGAGVLTWSIYSFLLRWRPMDLDGFTLFSGNVLIGTLVLAPFALYGPGGSLSIEWTPEVTSAVVYMAIFPSILAYMFWNRGVAELGAAKAGLFVHLTPVFGVLLSVLFLGETLRLYHGAGILLIFAGIYLATLSNTTGKLRAVQS